jgi:transposase
LASRRRAKKALIAVAHALLAIISHLLSRLVPYQDLGANYFDERERQALEYRLVRRLQKLGYEVALFPTLRLLSDSSQLFSEEYRTHVH